MGIAYIQADNDNLPVSKNCFSALVGFRDRGWEWKLFQNINDLSLTKDDVVVGGIKTTHLAFEQLGVFTPPPIDYPDLFRPFFRRYIELTTWKEAQEKLGKLRENGYFDEPRFIKPYFHKAWTGTVVTCFADLLKIGNPEPDYPVWLSEVTYFEDEYRVYFLNGEIVGMKHYKGQQAFTPFGNDFDQIRLIAKRLPYAAFCVDLGIERYLYPPTQTYVQDVSVVEVNDGFPLGNYGIDDVTYSKMLEARFLQIVNEPPSP